MPFTHKLNNFPKGNVAQEREGGGREREREGVRERKREREGGGGGDEKNQMNLHSPF